jgi:hypothetical protein
VLDKLITDNLLVAFEALHIMNGRMKGWKGYALQKQIGETSLKTSEVLPVLKYLLKLQKLSI